MASLSGEDAALGLSLAEAERSRSRSGSLSSTGSSGRLQLRHRVAQLMACVEDISSDDEIHEEVSRTLDEAFLIWGKKMKDKGQEFRFCCLQLVVLVAVSGLADRTSVTFHQPGEEMRMFLEWLPVHISVLALVLCGFCLFLDYT